MTLNRTVISQMFENCDVVDSWDEYSGYLTKDRPYEVSGEILKYLKSESWFEANFGTDYAKRFFSKAAMSSYINELFDPPCVDIGITFKEFKIPEDALPADECLEILTELENISDRRSFRMEIYMEDAEAENPWEYILFDDNYLARFIPLLKVDEKTMLFHAPHLYELMDHLLSIEGVAPFFARPRGPSAKLLDLARFF